MVKRFCVHIQEESVTEPSMAFHNEIRRDLRTRVGTALMPTLFMQIPASLERALVATQGITPN